MMLVLVGYVIAKVRAVGNVAINKQIRIPLGPELQPGARLRRIGFHIIAIKIEIRRSRSPTHLARAVLIDAVVGTETFVTVRVVNWNEKNYDVVEQFFLRFRHGDVS